MMEGDGEHCVICLALELGSRHLGGGHLPPPLPRQGLSSFDLLAVSAAGFHKTHKDPGGGPPVQAGLLSCTATVHATC